jgi:hypothetical protein
VNVAAAARNWRGPASLAAGLLAVGVALALPAPQQAAAPATSGPARLGEVWPSAKVVTIASQLPDGSAFQPLLLLDAATAVGIATSPDLATSRLVIRSGDGVIRTLRPLQGQQGSTVAALSAVADQLYWLELADGGDGKRTTTLWRAGLSGASAVAPATLLAADSSDLLYYDSAYDLQVVDGTIHWAAVGAEGGGELRSVPIAGGVVNVRKLDQLFALTAWPWVTSSGGSKPGDVELLNLTSGERRTVPAGASEILTCTPVWCRVTTLVNQGQSLKFEVEHLDGGDRRAIGNTSLTPLNTDVALLDRFEVLASTSSSNASGYAQKLWLEDLKAGRAVLLDDSVTATVSSRGSFLWWSTGNNETVSWHILDLRQLA